MNPENQELAGICTVVFSVRYSIDNPKDKPHVAWDYARSFEFHAYVHNLLRMADTSPPTTFICLRYAKRYMSQYKGDCPAGMERIIFVAAFMLADKFINDIPTKNWSVISGIDVYTLSTFEMHFLESLDHQLFIREDLYFKWCAECLSICIRFRESVIGFTFDSNVVFADIMGAYDPLLFRSKGQNQSWHPRVLLRYPETCTQVYQTMYPHLNTLDLWQLSLPNSPTGIENAIAVQEDSAMADHTEIFQAGDSNKCFSNTEYENGLKTQLPSDPKFLDEEYPFGGYNYAGALLTMGPFPTETDIGTSLGYTSSITPELILNYDKQLGLCSTLPYKTLPELLTNTLQASHDLISDDPLYTNNPGVYGNMPADVAQELLMMDSAYVDSFNTQTNQLLMQHLDPMLPALIMDCASVSVLPSPLEPQDVNPNSLMLSPYADRLVPSQCHAVRNISTQVNTKMNVDVPITPFHLTTRPLQFTYETETHDLTYLGCSGECLFDDAHALLPPFGI